MRKTPTRKIGVMGGMGPRTTITFYAEIVRLFQERRGARFNYEFPEIVIHNVPAPDNVHNGVGLALYQCMVYSAQLLAVSGVDFIAIPCNSAHAWIYKLQQHTSIPILNIVEETVRELTARVLHRPLLLGTQSTIGLGIYQRHSGDVDYRIPSVEDQEILTRIILEICASNCTKRSQQELIDMVGRYPSADSIILGCTELPIIAKPGMFELPVLNTSRILANATYREAVRETSDTSHLGNNPYQIGEDTTV